MPTDRSNFYMFAVDGSWAYHISLQIGPLYHWAMSIDALSTRWRCLSCPSYNLWLTISSMIFLVENEQARFNLWTCRLLALKFSELVLTKNSHLKSGSWRSVLMDALHKLRAGASYSESPARPRDHLWPGGNPTQWLRPPLLTRRQGYQGLGAG